MNELFDLNVEITLTSKNKSRPGFGESNTIGGGSGPIPHTIFLICKPINLPAPPGPITGHKFACASHGVSVPPNGE